MESAALGPAEDNSPVLNSHMYCRYSQSCSVCGVAATCFSPGFGLCRLSKFVVGSNRAVATGCYETERVLPMAGLLGQEFSD